MPKKEKKFKEKRKFFRHPISIPLEYKRSKKKDRYRSKTINVSFGGLLFLSRSKIAVGNEIVVSLPFKDRIFRVAGTVARCDKDTESTLYNVGIAFKKVTDAFKVKLVEQLHLIEEYRCLRSLQLQREVSLKQASEEWIKEYSDQFQKQYW